MAFDVKKQGIPGYIVLGSAGLALISLLMPWVSIDLGPFGSKSEIGAVNFWSWFYLIIGWGVPVFLFVTGKAANSAVAVVCGVIAALFGFYSALFRFSASMFGKTVNFASVGPWFFLIAALALIAAGILAAKGKGKIVDALVADAKDIKNIFKM